jgi:hypothetical protein
VEGADLQLKPDRSERIFVQKMSKTAVLQWIVASKGADWL